MKVMKLALIGTAALAAASVSVRADDLSSLKAQIETLNARVATLEATPSVPAGYSMVSFSRGEMPGGANNPLANSSNAHVITIMPTADAPAAASTVIVWTGWARAAVITGYNPGAVGTASAAGYSYSVQGATATQAVSVGSTASVPAKNYYTDIRAQAEIVVAAKTDTAVGEIGVKVALETAGQASGAAQYNSGNGAVTTDGFSGYWKMTPNLTLTGGLLGTLAKSSYSWDAIAYNQYAALTGGGVIGTEGFGNLGDPAAIQLAYADGPLAFAIQAEDAGNYGNTSAFGVSAKVGYKMDAFGFDLNGGYWGNPNGTANYGVSVGAGYTAGAFSFGAAIGTGQTNFIGTGNTTGNIIPASAYAKLGLSDQARIELGVTHDFSSDVNDLNANMTTYGGGIYYTPVKQLTIGVEAGYVTSNSALTNGTYAAGLVTVFSF